MTFTHHDGETATVYNGFNHLSSASQMEPGRLLAVVFWEGEVDNYVCRNDKTARVSFLEYLRQTDRGTATVHFLPIS